MNPLLHRLGVVRRRYQIVTVCSGLCALAALVIGGATVIGVFDYVNNLRTLLRAGALVGLLTGAGVEPGEDWVGADAVVTGAGGVATGVPGSAGADSDSDVASVGAERYSSKYSSGVSALK